MEGRLSRGLGSQASRPRQDHIKTFSRGNEEPLKVSEQEGRRARLSLGRHSSSRTLVSGETAQVAVNSE